MEVLLWLVVLVLVWVILGSGIARENERVVKIRLGRPYAVAESGLFWIPFGIAWVRRYTTKVVELQIAQRDEEGKIKRDANGKPIPAGGFITAPGEFNVGTNKRDVGPINIGVSLSFRFNWPQSKTEIFNCVKLLPEPDNTAKLTDLFQEIIMDETRSVGCTMTYLEIMQKRVQFAEQITVAMKQRGASQLLVDTGLDKTAKVVIDHIDIPEEARKALDDEEAKRLQAAGVVREAEGKKQKLKLEGEGRGQAIAAIKKEGGDDALQFESLRTLEEMAKGTSNTIFVPLDGLKSMVEKILNK